MNYPVTDLWTRLEKDGSAVLIYGTGDGADKIIDELSRRNISVAGIFASDGFVRKRVFRGFAVLSYSDADRLFPDLPVLMAFGSDRPEVLENVKKIAARHPFFFPDVPVAGNEIFDYPFFIRNRDRLLRVRQHLADERSRHTFDCIVSFKLSGDISYLFDCETPQNGDDLPAMPENAVFLDLGAFTGDTALEFYKTHPDCKKIIAVEPDKRNYRRLCENTAETGVVTALNAVASDYDGTVFFENGRGMGGRIAAGGEQTLCVKADTLLSDENGEIIIKADVEGGELNVLKGAEITVKNKKPYMIIDCYHRSDDLFVIPEKVLEYAPDYRIYMRHRPYLPAWETAFYFYPVNR